MLLFEYQLVNFLFSDLKRSMKPSFYIPSIISIRGIRSYLFFDRFLLLRSTHHRNIKGKKYAENIKHKITLCWKDGYVLSNAKIFCSAVHNCNYPAVAQYIHFRILKILINLRFKVILSTFLQFNNNPFYRVRSHR